MIVDYKVILRICRGFIVIEDEVFLVVFEKIKFVIRFCYYMEFFIEMKIMMSCLLSIVREV